MLAKEYEIYNNKDVTYITNKGIYLIYDVDTNTSVNYPQAKDLWASESD